MSKHSYKKRRLKYVFLAFTCATAFAFSGIAAACGNTDDSDEKDKTTTKEDTQLLKNGNFEFFTVPEKKENGNEPEYLIKSVENWTHGGTNSYTMSGIISTSATSWGKLSADDLADNLDYNNKLDSSSSNYLGEYIDYNGMKSTDILYKDQYEALKKDDDYKEGETPDPDRKNRIENPGTHYNVTEKDGKLYTDGGNGKEVFVNDKGEYFLEYDSAKNEYKQPISNVLMLHNYATAHNGIAQYYSSVEIELPANTAAEISLWVKTSYLKFNQGKTVSQDRGANITVTQTVGSSTLDNFVISSINTEKLIKEGASDKNNGWLEYTVYVNACDFASSKIKLQLGLGETGYTTEGYAFFDDVTVTKYAKLGDSASYVANKDKLDDDNTCNLSTDASEKIFKADSYVRNDNPVDERNSKDFHYYIDLASERVDYGDSSNTYTPVVFGSGNYGIKAGYTVDDDNYVSSKSPITGVKTAGYTENNLNAVDDKWRLPFASGIKTDEDFLAYATTGATPFNKNKTEYADKLNEALKDAVGLPKNSDKNVNNMLVMLSAYGAAYTTSFYLTVPAEGYQIVSFWVKTSDMGGSTAATLTITQRDNDENTANFTLDTTDKVTDIGDGENEKDIFNGWVQCFFFVKNELDRPARYDVDFSFGNTTIKGSAVHSYKKGWVALANMQTLNVNEDVFSYTGSGDTTASLTIVEDAEKKTQAFDEAYANQSHEIKNDAVIPSSYKGVNGASSAVLNNGHVSIPFDEFNNNRDNGGNAFTGLINKEYFTKDAYKDKSWYNTLCSNFNVSTIDATKAWNEIFGTKSVQPLIINNCTRESYVEIKGATEETFKNYYVKNDDGEFEKVASDAVFDKDKTYYAAKSVRNYGYIGSEKEVNADSYATISVRVKVSANAVAYIYLVDTSADKDVLSFKAPAYSFYYDVDGNVLKAEPKSNATVSEQRENVLYTLRDDGLYEDKDGKLYANTWNYKKLYYLENITYYDKPEGGNKLSIDDLVDGVTYYDENGKVASHYLVTDGGLKIYEYKDGNYHYIVDGKTQSETVNPFDTKYARYDYVNLSEDYQVEISGKEHADEWVTVTFVLHAGNAAKKYRVELWSGKRDETGEENDKNGSVIFDYSYTTVSDDAMKTELEQEIIKAYQNKLALVDGALDGIDTTGKNIAFYEKLAKEHNVTIDKDYTAHYYTYSLYDSVGFQPFNKTTASEGATGYDYKVEDQTETLAYLSVKDDNEYTVFADYSATDKTVNLNNPSDDKDDDDTEDNNESDGSIWLLASSIILVIALLFAMVAIFLRDAVKKARRNKVTSKNNYDQRKTNRYKRKLHLKQEEIVEVERENADGNTEETPVEEIPAEALEEVPVEETVEESDSAEVDSPETTAEEADDDDGKDE